MESEGADSDPTLEAFMRFRTELLLKSRETRESLNVWLASRDLNRQSLPKLAEFEGLLMRRRDVLDRLMKLDDDMLEHLVNMRTRAKQA